VDVQCDRCNQTPVMTHMLGFPLGGDHYWLCQECVMGILVMWLVEHRKQIERMRADRSHPA
jgi:hypothetical protein